MQALETFWEDVVSGWGTVKNALIVFFGWEKFWLILSFVATIASAVAAIFSYSAASRSAEVANDAQTFVVQSAIIQDRLASPRVNIIGGKVVYLETVVPEKSYESVRHRFRIQVTLRNSGDRDASPIWVALSSNSFGTPQARQFVLPKNGDLSLEEEFEISHDWSYRDLNVIVVLGYEDKTPSRISKNRNVEFLTTCSGPTGFKLSPSEDAVRAFKRSFPAHKEELPIELFLPPAQMLSLPTTENSIFLEGSEPLRQIQYLMNHCQKQQQ